MSLSAPSLLPVTHMLSQQYRDGCEQYHAAIISATIAEFRCSTPSAFESRYSAEKGSYRVLMTRVRLITPFFRLNLHTMREIQEISLQTLKSIGTSASYRGNFIQACSPAEHLAVPIAGQQLVLCHSPE